MASSLPSQENEVGLSNLAQPNWDRKLQINSGVSLLEFYLFVSSSSMKKNFYLIPCTDQNKIEFHFWLENSKNGFFTDYIRFFNGLYRGFKNTTEVTQPFASSFIENIARMNMFRLDNPGLGNV